MSLIGLADLLEAMGVPMRDYLAAQIAVQKAMLTPVRAPGGLEAIFHVGEGAYAWTAYRAGGHRTGVVVVESFMADGTTQRDVVEMVAMEQMLEWCPPLQEYPLGRLGRGATAVIMIDAGNRNLYLVDRDYFELDLRHRLRQVLEHWGAYQEGA